MQASNISIPTLSLARETRDADELTASFIATFSFAGDAAENAEAANERVAGLVVDTDADAASGLGDSQATHCEALAAFGTMQTEHVQPPTACGFLAPAAPQSNCPGC